jgi:hypothetical protein
VLIVVIHFCTSALEVRFALKKAPVDFIVKPFFTLTGSDLLNEKPNLMAKSTN